MATSATMKLDELPNELLVQIFLSCPDHESVLSLGATCKSLREVAVAPFTRVAILHSALDAQYGPLDAILQLVPHVPDLVPHDRWARVSRMGTGRTDSFYNLMKVVSVGKVAENWASVYEQKKWKVDFVNRRFLSPQEKRRIRGAIYRLWYFDVAFRLPSAAAIHGRISWFGSLSDVQLAQMLDLFFFLRDRVESKICPSDRTICRRVRKRFPDYHPYIDDWKDNVFPNPQLTDQIEQYYYSLPSSHATNFGWAHRHRPTANYSPIESEGWGSRVSQRLYGEEVLALNPRQLLHLLDMTHDKGLYNLKYRVAAKVRDWVKEKAAVNGTLVGSSVQLVPPDTSGAWMRYSQRKFGFFWMLDHVWNGRNVSLEDKINALKDGMVGIVTEKVEAWSLEAILSY